MIFTATPLLGSFIVDIKTNSDQRGWFARTFCKIEFEEINHHKEWVQINHSFTALQGTIRGMHYQLAPYAEIKLVRCIAGAVFDTIIDLREGSPTFLQWFGIDLSAVNKRMIYIPEGFAHGFQALTDGCELIYHHTEFYKPDVEGGIRYDDDMLRINWPLLVTAISDRDRQYLRITPEFKGIKI